MNTVVESQYLSSTEIVNLIEEQRTFFRSQQTLSVAFRRKQLEKLKTLIVKHEKDIMQAVYKDLHKNEFEAYATEVGFLLVELDKTLSSLSKWAKPRKMTTPLFLFGSKSYQYPEPYGNTLIVSPWNYPVLLAISPLIGALAAGNTAIVKPSEYAPHTAAVLSKMINQNFDKGLLHVVEGEIEETQTLLSEKFDYIFFTGSTKVGKIVYQAAAKHLTPVTLELGGKSPCIIDRDTDLKVTAKRVLWGKFVNAGQTCIAPDHIYVHESVKEAFIAEAKKVIESFFGANAQESNAFPRIISPRHFDRIKPYLEQGNILHGGASDRNDKYIEPTLIEPQGMDCDMMTTEIFGPILPIISYTNISEVIGDINNRPKPLALYIFSTNKNVVEKVLKEVSSGGACVNDTLMHLANGHLPFGGVGASGIGAYHGQASFDTFSHLKSVLKRPFMIEEPIRYAPYKFSVNLLKKVMKWTLG